MSPVRIAVVCTARDCGWRQFGELEAKCPQHHLGQIQVNRPYCGQPTPQPKKGKR